MPLRVVSGLTLLIDELIARFDRKSFGGRFKVFDLEFRKADVLVIANMCFIDSSLKDVRSPEGRRIIQCEFVRSRFESVSFRGVVFADCQFEDVIFEGCSFDSSCFDLGVLIRVTFLSCTFGNCEFRSSSVHSCEWSPGTLMRESRISGGRWDDARLVDANLREAVISPLDWHRVVLAQASLGSADLSGGHFALCSFDGVDLRGGDLRNATFVDCSVSPNTVFRECLVNENTCMDYVTWEVARIDDGFGEAMRYNRRRRRWEEWYGGHRFLKYVAGPFWIVSDYGSSTKRLATSAILGMMFFGSMYLCMPALWGRAILVGSEFCFSAKMVILAAYAAVVITFGAGDVSIESSILARSIVGAHIVFSFFVFGALVTRLALLSESTGPGFPRGHYRSDVIGFMRLVRKDLKSLGTVILAKLGRLYAIARAALGVTN